MKTKIENPITKPLHAGGYPTRPQGQTSIRRNTSTEGEPMEIKVRRIVENKEPTNDPLKTLHYQERKAGVEAAYNPRTDRWDIAIEALNKATKSKYAQREANMKIVKNDDTGENNQSTEATKA